MSNVVLPNAVVSNALVSSEVASKIAESNAAASSEVVPNVAMSRAELTICRLYPREMNIYGDMGNALVLQKRCERRGIGVSYSDHHPGNSFPSGIDIVLGGGGQDSGQIAVREDLARIASQMKTLAYNNMPMLVICGMYQLFGSHFVTATGETIKGLGILDLFTQAGDTRMIGNIITQSSEFGRIVGYENHSGRTWLGKDAKPLAEVVKGDGNNGKDKTEGARLANVIGSYLHGPLLPKNPQIADFLILKALENKYGSDNAKELMEACALDDSMAVNARTVAEQRPR
ncbi:MAG: glutamine amidotransferase [Coriobacteriales bacterium]|nr:glutamine amidotransferase [Coriobacteriales bacterium]